MDWYFRKWPEPWFLRRENMPRLPVTGYRILYTVTVLVLAAYAYALRNNQNVLNRLAIISAIIFLGFILLFILLPNISDLSYRFFWLGCVESKAESRGAWFFHTDHGPRIFNGMSLCKFQIYPQTNTIAGVKFVYALSM